MQTGNNAMPATIRQETGLIKDVIFSVKRVLTLYGHVITGNSLFIIIRNDITPPTRKQKQKQK